MCGQVAVLCFVVAFGFTMAARLTKFFKIFDCGRFDNDQHFGMRLKEGSA